ncbi:MAG TPA: hypothetical protein VEU77_07915, partial [Candidatus Acidoferrales bacterium]|nr:hypothetical protein [Candidatus Acidoferrales bacterium]
MEGQRYAGRGLYEIIEQVYATGRSAVLKDSEIRIDRGNGPESRTATVVLQPLRDDGGKVNGVISFAVDVTEADA